MLEDKETKILGLQNRWVFALAFAAFCVFVEVVLNIGGQLVWEYPWWNRSFAGIWLIFLFGYFHFFVAIIFMLYLKTMKKRLMFIGLIYSIAIVLNVVGLGILGFVY